MSTGIDIGSNGLKLVRIGGGAGRPAVTGAARWAPSGAHERNGAAAKVLRDILRRAPHASSDAVVGLTGREVNLQYSILPPVAPHIFRAMMRHEMEHIAGQGGDLYVDYCVTSEPARRGPKGDYTVVIGRAKSQVVEERRGVATSAGLKEVDACPNAIALYQATAAGGQAKPGEIVLAVDVGAENLEFVIVEGRTLLFARNVSSGARLFTDAIASAMGVAPAEAERIKRQEADLTASEEQAPGLAGALRTAAAQFGNVIQSSIGFARVQLKRQDLKPARCLLSGGGARLRGLREYLQGALGMPVEWNEPFRALDCRGLPEEVAADLQAAPTDMALALGLALAGSARGAPVRLSLLPAGLKQTRSTRRRRALTIPAGVLYAAGLAALAAVARTDHAREEAALEDAKARRDRYEAKVEEFAALRAQQARRAAQAEILGNEVRVGRAVVEPLARLQRLLPEGMWISSMTMDRGEAPDPDRPCKGVALVLKGLADEGSLKNPYELLRRIAGQLSDPREASDPAGSVSAEASQLKASGRPGWLEFEFTVCIPQFEPPEEKPAEGETEAE
jgi:type IV pilus assembly protein PilM